MGERGHMSGPLAGQAAVARYEYVAWNLKLVWEHSVA